MTKNRVALSVIAVIAILAAWYLTPDDAAQLQEPGSSGAMEMVAVIIPELTGNAAAGAGVFGQYCAVCHGPNAGGIEGSGPPLIHKIYEPGHHGDLAFVRAAKQGVRAHHWKFGNMPPVEGITDAEVSAIIAYIRSVQRANGIF